MKSQNAPRPQSGKVVVQVENTADQTLLACDGPHRLHAGLMGDFEIFSPSHTSGSGQDLCLPAGMRHKEEKGAGKGVLQ